MNASFKFFGAWLPATVRTDDFLAADPFARFDVFAMCAKTLFNSIVARAFRGSLGFRSNCR